MVTCPKCVANHCGTPVKPKQSNTKAKVQRIKEEERPVNPH